MQKFSSFGRKKNRPKFDIEWLCCDVFNCLNVMIQVFKTKEPIDCVQPCDNNKFYISSNRFQKVS